MKTLCITIAIAVAFLAIAFAIVLFTLRFYVWLKLRGWNITFDDSVKTAAEAPVKHLPARDAKGRFIKRQ